MPWTWLAAAVLANVAVVLGMRLLDRVQGQLRSEAWLTLGLLTAAIPAIVPLSHPPLRFVASLVTITVLVKMYDLSRTPDFRTRLSFRGYLAYCVNGFWLVLRQPPAQLPEKHDRLRLAPDFLRTCVALAVTVVVFRIDWANHSFLLEHLAKVPAVVLTTAMAANLAGVLWRLAGGQGHVPMRDFWRASTPLEFWQRWNIPAQQFFAVYVFAPAGGMRRPVRGILLTFLVSGLVHEYVIGIAAGRVVGLQLLFFLLQGLGVIASRQRPQAPRAAAFTTGLTLLFNLTTAVLFFVSLNAAVPFYVDR